MRKAVALTLFLLAALLSPPKAAAQFNKAYFYYVGREFLIDSRYREAIETLNILLKVDPESYEGYRLRGIAKYNLDDLLGAESDFSMAIEKNPVYTPAYHARAMTRLRLGNYDDALKDFEEAIDLRPDLPYPYYSRGITYLLNQQFDLAIRDFDHFIRQQPRVADAYISRGTSYLHKKDTTAAYENYNAAIRTNRENPDGYNRRGALYMTQQRNPEALTDFNKAIECDSAYLLSYFNRAILYSRMNRPMLSLSDFDKVIELDSTSSLSYFNRALVRSQIGDYNRALDDYNKVALYSPGNVLVYFNRALLYSQLGDLPSAIKDYTKAIELYPDFANAYLGRSNLRYLMKDTKGSREDRNIAEKKISEYRSRLQDSTFSIWADTSRQFNQLLSFDSKLGSGDFAKIHYESNPINLLPLFKFTLLHKDTVATIDPKRYYVERVEDFRTQIGNPLLTLSTRPSDVAPDSLIAADRRIAGRLNAAPRDWKALFERGLTQSLIRQYTNAVNNYEKAIALDPSNPMLYINLSTTRSEMIDFVSSIDNGMQRISVDNDPATRMKGGSTRTYNYDEAIGELNKAAKLMPDFAHIYYNRGNLQALSGNLPEAFDDYSKAIELNPFFAEAYYNRGLVQIFLNDTRKGCLDVSKAGELGVKEAYAVLKRYAQPEN